MQLCHGEVCWVPLQRGGKGFSSGSRAVVLSRLEFSAPPQASRNASGRLLNLSLCLLPFNENCSFSQQNAERASDSEVLLIICLAEAVMLSAVWIQVQREEADSLALCNEERQMLPSLLRERFCFTLFSASLTADSSEKLNLQPGSFPFSSC